MTRILLFFFGILYASGLFSQNYRIAGTIAGLANQDIYLMQILAEKQNIIDTVQTDPSGNFSFELTDQIPVGLYAVISGKNQMIELIFNKENILFVTTGNTASDQVQIVESTENRIYYDYLYAKGMTLYKIDLLKPLLANYPPDDPFYEMTLMQFNLLKENFQERVSTLKLLNPGTFAAHVIKADEPLIPDPLLSLKLQNMYLRSHYLDSVNFTDTLLTRTNILSSKVVGYLSLYQEDGMTKEQLETSILAGLDTVLLKASTNQLVYEYVFDYLINGFQAIGFERGLEYLAAQNQLEQFCVNTERKKELEDKVELISRLAIGQPAPEFETIDLNKKMIRLSDINAETTLLIFWASWCPHCDEIMPAILEHYDPKNKRELEVIAISIDESEDAVRETIAENNYNWINIAELQGWDGPVVRQYGISATPGIFILDKNKKIVAKPVTLQELNHILQAPIH